ncbi:MAG: hypothetical protein WEA56_10700 [Balneolaceae bacterium]
MPDKKEKDQENQQTEAGSKQERLEVKRSQLKVSIRRAAIGGGVSGLITFTGAWIIGDVSGNEAFVLLESALPAARSFAANVLLATSTILALMLTLLSFSYNTKINLKWAHYQRVKHIAWIDTLTLISAILTFLLLNIPLEESSNSPALWYSAFYYTSLVLSSLLSAAIITVILMLYDTIKDVIEVIGPGETDSELQSKFIQTEKKESD